MSRMTNEFEAGRGFGKTASAYRQMSGRPLRMSKAPATYTINTYGVVTRCAPWDNVVKFVPPYVPAKASRVYPALKTCTSPRRAARYVNDILRAQDDDAREDAWFVQRYAG